MKIINSLIDFLLVQTLWLWFDIDEILIDETLADFSAMSEAGYNLWSEYPK